jgi:putative spermidine/putrescine transport system substrate-binding protein
MVRSIATVVVLVAAYVLPLEVRAADELVHATWGGGGADTFRRAIAAHFTSATQIAIKVAEVPNTAGVIRSPAAAAQYNTVTVTFFEAVALARDGLLEPFDDKDLPHLSETPEAFIIRDGGNKVVGLPAYFAYYAIAYNTDLAKKEDFLSWNDLANPKWKGKLAITRSVYAAPYDLVMLAKANGGDASNIDPGLPILQKIVGNTLATYTSLAHMNTLLGRGEVAAVPFYSTRIWHLKREGVRNVDMVIPKEGALMLAYATVVPKGVKHRTSTGRFLDYLSTAEPQLRGAMLGGGIPTNTTAKLPSEFEESLGITRAELMKKVYAPDWRVIVQHHEERVNMVEKLMAAAPR